MSAVEPQSSSPARPAECVLDPGRFVKLQIWTRHTEDWGDETIYKLPDGTEYRGDVYGHVDGAL